MTVARPRWMAISPAGDLVGIAESHAAAEALAERQPVLEGAVIREETSGEQWQHQGGAWVRIAVGAVPPPEVRDYERRFPWCTFGPQGEPIDRHSMLLSAKGDLDRRYAGFDVRIVHAATGEEWQRPAQGRWRETTAAKAARGAERPK